MRISGEGKQQTRQEGRKGSLLGRWLPWQGAGGLTCRTGLGLRLELQGLLSGAGRQLRTGLLWKVGETGAGEQGPWGGHS